MPSVRGKDDPVRAYSIPLREYNDPLSARSIPLREYNESLRTPDRSLRADNGSGLARDGAVAPAPGSAPAATFLSDASPLVSCLGENSPKRNFAL
jgi:hypothetical protein